MPSSDSPATRLATRLAFLVSGFGIACWAPLVPFAKQRLGVHDGGLGLLLLCIGAGSVTAMMAAGPLTARHGSKPVIVTGGIAIALILPLLALAATPVSLGAALLGFGAAMGAMDVAMNIHAVEVERGAGRPLMSGFHALFSIGGFVGASLMTFLLGLHVSPLAGTLAGSALVLGAMALAAPRLLTLRDAHEGPLFVRPRGIVMVLAAMTGIAFLAEGRCWTGARCSSSGAAWSRRDKAGWAISSLPWP
jgi:predicted MFS family arabinose efflux permease